MGAAGPPAYVDGEYVAERRFNPFVRSLGGARALSMLQLPLFATLPPAGFGVLTTTGRRTGKARRRCVRAIRRDDRAYVVAIGGARAAWLRNIRANPKVHLRIRDGTFTGRARELRGEEEVERARKVYCETVKPTDYAECALHRRGRPSAAKIRELHRAWFEGGTPLVIELRR